MGKQIKDTNIIRTPEVVIDPQFYVPEDVTGIRPATTEDLIPDDPDQDYLSGVDYDVEILNDGDVSINDGTGSIDTVDVLQTPQTISIVSQTVRFTPDGQSVVDVVIAVEDVLGATNYEVRIST